VLTAPYAAADAAGVTRYANLLLPALFGVDAERARDATRGFDSIEQYLAHATCARHLDSQLARVRESLFTVNHAYTAESVLTQKYASDTLYAFHGRGVVHLPFRWFWQCVLLSRRAEAGERGAPQDWFRGLTDEDAAAPSGQCEAFVVSFPAAARISVKTRLQTSSFLYTMTNNLPEMAAAMAHDMDDTRTATTTRSAAS